MEDSNVSDGHGGFLGSSNHEEADTRLMLYAASALTRGGVLTPGAIISVELRSVDSDVVIVALSIFSKLITINKDANVWVTLGYWH